VALERNRVLAASDVSLHPGQVVLHLEECPAEPDLQEALWAGVQRTLASVRSRYGSLMGNIITVVTSNHSPAPVPNPNPTARIVLHSGRCLSRVRCVAASVVATPLGCNHCAGKPLRSHASCGGFSVLRRVRCALSFERDEPSC
jgi:hypothetical protein